MINIDKLSRLLESDKGKELILDSIAEVLHESWINWTKDIAKNEDISVERRNRWDMYWKIDYCKIPLDEKKPEHEIAIRILRRLGIELKK